MVLDVFVDGFLQLGAQALLARAFFKQFP